MTLESMARTYNEMFNINIYKYPLKVQNGLLDIEENHNTSWTLDVYKKNKRNLDKRAVFYRGANVTYKELFSTVEQYAAAFKALGVKEGMEIPMCMANCPEFIYVILALNLLNARMNCFGIFDMDYITEIIDGCEAPFIICTDDVYSKIEKSIENSKVENILMFSLADSLPNGEDPYIELDLPFYDFKNRVTKYQIDNKRIFGKAEFINLVECPLQIEDYTLGDLNSEFLITYSSGSTNSNRPKAIVHSNRSLVTMGRFQERDLSDLPSTEDLIGEALIPTHSNTDIITSISDVLYKACTVALEPIYNREFFLDSISINRPNYISVPRNMLVHAMKKIYADPKYKNFTMPYMMLLTSVGEPTSIGEEQFINKMLKKAKCGVEKLPLIFAPVPVSIGGGNCECGGLFFTPYRKYQDLLPQYLFSGKRIGLKQYRMVQSVVLDCDGKNVAPDSVGRLVVKTPTVMKRYKNNIEATNDFWVYDSEGGKWADCKVYARKDKFGTIKILGRMGNELVLGDGRKVPLYSIGEIAEQEYKKILSYEVVNVKNTLVIHIECQPGIDVQIPDLLLKIDKRIERKFGQEVCDKVFYRIRSFDEGFIGTGCEKRNYNVLMEEGISHMCVKPILNGERQN